MHETKETVPSEETGKIDLDRAKVLESKTGKTLTFDEMVDALRSSTVIFVGETHSRREDHAVQLRIVKDLFRESRGRLAIGMEMFQRRYQDALDRYVAGEINEEQLREQTDWAHTWRHDFSFWADILRFARQNKIPVIGLNVRNEIPRKVAKEGYDALDESEKAEIPKPWPPEISKEYRKYLKKEFKGHHHGGIELPERFIQAQLVWDTTMAEAVIRTVEAYRAKHGSADGFHMVALAGKGHVDKFSALPKRVEENLKLPCSVVIPMYPDESKDYEPDEADYFVTVQNIKQGKGMK